MMTDRARTEQERRIRVPSSARGIATETHRAFWEEIRAEVTAIVQEYAPTFGEVTGMDGGKVKVQVDGEEEPRQVGLTKKRGQRYRQGDRVKIQKSRSGEEFVDGTFGSKSGKDPVVGGDDVDDNAVESRHMSGGSVTKQNNALAPESVSRNNFDRDTDKFITDQGDRGVDKANEAMDEAKSKADKNHSHNYADNNHNHNEYADKSHNHSGFADKTHDHSMGDVSKLQEEINKLKARLDKLEKKGN